MGRSWLGGGGGGGLFFFFFFQAEDGIRDWSVTGVQTCALPIWWPDTGFMVHITVNYGDASVILVHGGVELGQGINTKVWSVIQTYAFCFL